MNSPVNFKNFKNFFNLQNCSLHSLHLLLARLHYVPEKGAGAQTGVLHPPTINDFEPVRVSEFPNL